MKSSKRAGLAPLFLILAAGLVAVSCDNTYHVFDEIQTEVKQTGTDVFKNVTVKALADDGTHYYAAMAKIWYRPIAGGAWEVLSAEKDGADRSDYSCFGLVSGTGGSIYVGAELDGNLGVYKVVFAAGDWTWTAVPSGSLASLDLDALFFVNAKLFALTHSGSGNTLRYSLHYSDGSSAFAATTLESLEVPVLALGHDGSAYFAATSTTIYSSASETGVWSDTSPTTDKTYGGLAVDHANKVRVSSSDGYLYTRSAGAWSATAAEIKKNQKLGLVAEVEVSTGAYRLLIAHDNSGYYECDTSTDPVTAIEGGVSSTAFGTPSSAYTTTISGKAVLAIHRSSTGSGLLIGLASQGSSTGYALYSNPLVSGTWSGWTAE